MGGYGALRFAFAHPELFSAASGQSAALITQPPEEIEATAKLAVAIARAAARLPGEPVRLAEVEPVQATWSSPMQEDPFSVPLEEKVALLMEASRRMQSVKGVSFAEAGIDLYRRHNVFGSSEGALIVAMSPVSRFAIKKES